MDWPETINGVHAFLQRDDVVLAINADAGDREK
jgi:hypothetical protein